jgi:hypothetical protein
MSPIASTDLDKITSTIALAMQQGFAQLTSAFAQMTPTVTPKASPRFLAKGAKAAPSDLAAKDARIVAAFTKRGFKNVVLIDRANPKAAFNIKPFKAWLTDGRVVRKGQKGIRGLFHVDQTDVIPASPKPKGKFGKARPHLQPVA